MEPGHRDITLFELEILRDLRSHPSLRSLSRAKGIEPPHLSKVISRIEKKLGLSVVKRSPKGFLLTPDGLGLVARAGEIVGLAEGLTGEQRSSAERRTVTIAAARFVAACLVAPCLEALRGRPPDAGDGRRFRLIDMSPDEVASAAVLSACEAVVTVGEPALTRAWESTVVGRARWGLYCASGHPLPSRASAARVLGYSFVVPAYWKGLGFETGNDYCPVPWALRRRGDESSSILTAVEIARRSEDQILFAPRVAVRRELDSGTLREVSVAGWPRVEKDVVLSVKMEAVSQRLRRDLVEALGRGLA